MRHIQQRNAAAPGKAVESLVGFEPTTRCLEGSRSVQLSYRDTQNTREFYDKTYIQTSRRPNAFRVSYLHYFT